MNKEKQKRFGFAVDNETADRFLEVCRVTRISQTKLGQEAIEDLIKKYEHLLNKKDGEA